MYKKILLFFTIIVGAVLVAVFISFSRQIEVQVEGIIGRELMMVEDKLRQSQASEIRLLNDEALELAEESELQRAIERGETYDMSNIFFYFKSSHPDLNIDLIMVTNPIGDIVYTSDFSELVGRSLASRDAMKYTMKGTAESDIWVLLNEVYLVSLCPVIKKDEKFVGVLILGVLLDDEFADQLKQHLGSDMSIYYTGRFLGSSLPSGVHALEVGADGMVAAAMKKATRAGKTTPIKRNINKANYLAWFCKPLTSDNRELGTYVLYRSLDDAMALAMDPLQKSMAYVALFALVGAFIIAFFFTRSITNPLVKLTRVADKIARGDYEIDVKIEAADEVGMLANRLDWMREELKKQMQELQDFNRSLEVKVHERTEKLAKALSDNLRLYEDALQKTEELRIAHSEAQEASRLKSEFLANMSHELRTPLNSIISLSEILLSKLDGPLTKEQEKQTKIIAKSGQMLLHLINDVLDLAKIEAGKMSVTPEKFNVVDTIYAIVGTIEPLALERNLQIYTNIDNQMLTGVYNDENKLQQVLLNLLSNAVKFTPKGWIKLNAKTNPKNPKEILIEVSDSGIGIAPSNHEKIFQEFLQVDGSSTRNYGGTGLGLAISKHLVYLLGGDIWVESDGKNGSTFSFTFDIEANLSLLNVAVTEEHF